MVASRAGKEPVIQDNINYRRHRNACKHYREDWGADDALYRCICLLDTPPETREEQDLCLKSRRGCWRLKAQLALASSHSRTSKTAEPSSDDSPLEGPKADLA